MVIKDKADANIERHKQRLGLVGDVYLINGVLIEDLYTHRLLIPTSIATTIEEAEQERIEYEERLNAARIAMQQDEEEA